MTSIYPNLFKLVRDNFARNYGNSLPGDCYHAVSEDEINSPLRVLVDLEGANILDPDLVDYTALKVQRLIHRARYDEYFAPERVDDNV